MACAPPLPASSAPPPHMSVLVVEDEPLLRWAISESLSAAGHLVLQAADGTSAVAAVEGAAGLDVILLDFRLPDSNDFGLLTRLRAMAPASAVVMMTACNTPELTTAARALGAALVLDKPFDLQSLDARLRAACARGGAA